MEGKKKDDGSGVIEDNDEPPGDVWFGIGVAVVTGIGDEKGSAPGANNSFVSMVR